jgi:hypothetical protein
MITIRADSRQSQIVFNVYWVRFAAVVGGAGERRDARRDCMRRGELRQPARSDAQMIARPSVTTRFVDARELPPALADSIHRAKAQPAGSA